MSAGTIPLAQAAILAADVVRALRAIAPSVSAEPVGSVRRCRPVVGDVEVLVRGEILTEKNAPAIIGSALLKAGITPGAPNKAGAKASWGARYFRALAPGIAGPIGLDVFVCLPPAEYGVLRLIRTGDRHFSQAVVTRLHRFGLRSEDGRVIDKSERLLPTPTEEGVLRLARLPWIPPSERHMDNATTTAAFRREAAPWECRDPDTACPKCGMAHAMGACP